MEANNMAAMREALEDSNGLLEELAMMGEWGDAARGQIAENNAALAATATHEKSPAVGDCAKLREALKAFVDSIEWLCDGDESGLFRKRFAVLLSDARAALAAPARNCDKFPMVKDAATEFSKLRTNPHPCPDFVFSRWLLSAVTEGGAS